jgi:hypothetical protein
VEFREACAEVEAERLETVVNVARNRFEVIDALNGEAAAAELHLSGEHFATMSWGHCHEEAAWEEYHDEEAAGEECREVVELVVLQRLTKSLNAILLDHHDHYQGHYFQDH